MAFCNRLVRQRGKSLVARRIVIDREFLDVGWCGEREGMGAG